MDQPSLTATDHAMFAQGATSSPSRHSMGASPSPAAFAMERSIWEAVAPAYHTTAWENHGEMGKTLEKL